MEVFEVHLKMINNSGKKLPFVSKKVFAVTGWEATELTRKFINDRLINIASMELEYWKVLNPFKAHFFDQTNFAFQKKKEMNIVGFLMNPKNIIL